MTSYRVLLTEGASRDLQELHEYVAEHDAPAKADRLIDRLIETVDSLASLPERGSYPRELLKLGIREYRQVLFKPYRIIYSVSEDVVVVYLVVDGRRDMQSLLMRRLLRS